MKTEKTHGIKQQPNESKRPRRTIRFKLIRMTVLLAIVPLIVSCLISAVISINGRKTDAYDLVANRADSVAQQVESYVQQSYLVIESLASGTDIRSLDPQLQTNILTETIKHNPSFILLYQQDTNGDQTARTSGTLGNRADRWWFIQEMQTQQPFVSKSYFDLNTNEAVTSIIFPVLGDDKQMTGVLAADLSLSKLQEIVDHYNTQDIYTVVIDGEGCVVAHTDQTQVQEMYNYKTATKTVRSADGSDMEQSIQLPEGLQELTTELLNGASGVTELKNIQGKNSIYGYYPVEIPGDSDSWGVITIELKDAAYASTYDLVFSNIIFTAIMVVLVILISVLFARSLTRPLMNLSKVAERIAQGDLDVQLTVERNDEIGDVSLALDKTVVRLQSYIDYINEITHSLNQISHGNLCFELHHDYAGEFQKVKEALFNIRTTLSDTLSQIKGVAQAVNDEAAALYGGSQDLAQGTTKQAASIEELSTSIMQISAHVKTSTKNAQDAETISVQAGEMVAKGNQQMQDMVQAMEDISDSSKEIGKIIKTIDDIAFQTNILALNAAVEAARAGAAGKGFAVVADEVRSLAQKSAEAAKNTSELIEHSVSTVGKGTRIVYETAESLQFIVEGSNKTLALVREIASASSEQSVAVEEVTIGVERVAEVVQMTAATASESADASGKLSSHSARLKALVDQFKVDES